MARRVGEGPTRRSNLVGAVEKLRLPSARVNDGFFYRKVLGSPGTAIPRSVMDPVCSKSVKQYASAPPISSGTSIAII
jgi:hypothetical protein